jgi:hypothetical protein
MLSSASPAPRATCAVEVDPTTSAPVRFATSPASIAWS